LSTDSDKQAPPNSLLPATVQKLIITTVLGGVTYLLTSLAGQDQIWSVILSVFIGGAVFVIQFLIDVDARLQIVQLEGRRHYDTVETLVEMGFSRINEATELFGLVERSPLQTDVVTQLVRNCTQLNSDASDIIHRFAQSEILRLSQFLRALAEGNAVYEGEDRDWLLGLAANTRACLDAISLTTVDAGGFWRSDLGQRYVGIQRDLIGRGVQIRRIFVVESRTRSEDADLKRIIALQADIGIDVRILDSAQIPETRKSSLFDFILFDNAVSYEVTPGSFVEDGTAPAIVNTRLILEEPRVAERVSIFMDLWEASGAY
jgi:hypothetical protein